MAKQKPPANTKFTPEIRAKVLGAIREGLYAETAAALAGLHKDTFYEWLKRGAREKDGEYGEFVQAVEEARAHAQQRGLSIMRLAALSNPVKAWQAEAWRLERMFPDLYSRNRLDDGKKNASVVLNFSVVPVKGVTLEDAKAAQDAGETTERPDEDDE